MKKLIRWLIKSFLPGYHLSRNPKRIKKVDHLPINDRISTEYRTSHLRGTFPGTSMGD